MIHLAPYDATWPLEFEAEAERIARACAGCALRLEHIGSTAVPGLSARPIIDIMAGRPPRVHLAPYIAALRQLGYDHLGSHGVPGREYFRRGHPRSHDVHLVSWNGAFWREHLGFRDYLRAHGETAGEFEALKRELAGRFADDHTAYATGKGPFVRSVLRVMSF